MPKQAPHPELQTRLVVEVHPNASRNEIKSFQNEVLHVRIAAPPIEGKANKELVEFLAGLLKVSRTSISIEKGMTSRKKVLVIKGLHKDGVLDRFQRNMHPTPQLSDDMLNKVLK